MILWWLGDVILLLVVLPIVIYLLAAVLARGQGIVPQRQRDLPVAAAGSKDLDAVPLLLTTQDQVSQNGRGGRRLRQLARRDPRRRVSREGDTRCPQLGSS